MKTILKRLLQVILLGGIVISSLLYVRPTWFLGSHFSFKERLLRQKLKQAKVCLAKRKRAGSLTDNIVFDYVIALEDRSFWKRPLSFDLRGIVRAVWKNLRGKREGASGIPQQTVSMTILEKHKHVKHNLRFKVEQFLLASRSFRQVPRQVWEWLYLKNFRCRSGIQGIQPCAVYYFGEPLHPEDPNLQFKAALLAAQIKAPTRLYNKPKLLRKRALYAMKILAKLKQTKVPKVKWSTLSWKPHRNYRELASIVSNSLPCATQQPKPMQSQHLGLRFAALKAATALKEKLQQKGHFIELTGAIQVADKAFAFNQWGTHPFPAASLVKVFMLESLLHLGHSMLPFILQVRLQGKLPVWDFVGRPWRPKSVGRSVGPETLLEAVARSYNSSCLKFLYFPYWLSPRRLRQLRAQWLTPREIAKFSNQRDRDKALLLLERVSNFPYTEYPSQADPAFTYRSLLLLALRVFQHAIHKRMPQLKKAPTVPSLLLGSSISATPKEWVNGLHRVFFRRTSQCHLSMTGSLLAEQFSKEGTLHTLSKSLRYAKIPGKTGTSPFSAAMVASFCYYNARTGKSYPVTVGFWAFHPSWKKIRLFGGQLRPAIEGMVRTLTQTKNNLFEPTLHPKAKQLLQRWNSSRAD